MDYYNNMYQKPFQSRQNIDWIMVQNVNQVELINVQPMQKAWIMVQNEPIFALRTADNMGLVTTEYYKFEKYDKAAQASGYVTKDELEAAISKIIKEVKADESTMAK